MKNLFILLVLLINLSACEVFRPASRRTDNLSVANIEPSGPSQAEFIQDISTGNTGVPADKTESPLYRESSGKTDVPKSGNETFNSLQFKYAILTNSPVEELNNPQLLFFMDQWYGVPYSWAEKQKEELTVPLLPASWFPRYIISTSSRMSADQYKATRRIHKEDLREGDLVFFHTLGRGHKVTHVGIYLYNNRFVHASVSGVQINDLGEGYYSTHFVGGGQLEE